MVINKNHLVMWLPRLLELLLINKPDCITNTFDIITLRKIAWGGDTQTDRQTDKQTDGHRDLLTESASGPIQ